MALNIFTRYAPRANPADADYPNGSIKNESIPGANDGTPLEADWGNDYVGFDAALLDAAGITPSGDPDTATNSQRLDAIKAVLANGTFPVKFQNGTSPLPSISFASDPDTGWYRKAANTIAAVTAGLERLIITAAGRIGIGLPSPAAKLHVRNEDVTCGIRASSYWTGTTASP